MKAKIAIVGVFVLAIVVILALKMRGENDASRAQPPGSGSAQADSSARPSGSVTEITMTYSSEKKEWLELAAADFRKEHPEIKLDLVPKGSLDAALAILDDKDRPTIFSPADSLILNLLVSDWKMKGRSSLVGTSGKDEPQSLMITPLVLVIWEDREHVLAKTGGGRLTWKGIHKAITSNKGWPAVGGKPEWGFVKFGHTDPTKSNSGLQALYLMSLEYFNKPTLEVGDLLKPEYQTFIKEIEKGVAKFEASTGQFMTEMVRFGPSKYDIAVVYENLAISQIANAQGRWGNLKIYYPSPTLWSDHPAAVLQGEWVTPAQAAAAHVWLDYLRTRPVQERALTFGFRPGDPSIPVKTGASDGPFTKLAQYGIAIDIPPVAKTPDGAVVQNLVTMWSRIAAPQR